MHQHCESLGGAVILLGGSERLNQEDPKVTAPPTAVHHDLVSVT